MLSTAAISRAVQAMRRDDDASNGTGWEAFSRAAVSLHGRELPSGEGGGRVRSAVEVGPSWFGRGEYLTLLA